MPRRHLLSVPPGRSQSARRRAGILRTTYLGRPGLSSDRFRAQARYARRCARRVQRRRRLPEPRILRERSGGGPLLRVWERRRTTSSDRTREVSLEQDKRCKFGNDPWTLWDGFQTLPRPWKPLPDKGFMARCDVGGYAPGACERAPPNLRRSLKRLRDRFQTPVRGHSATIEHDADRQAGRWLPGRTITFGPGHGVLHPPPHRCRAPRPVRRATQDKRTEIHQQRRR